MKDALLSLRNYIPDGQFQRLTALASVGGNAARDGAAKLYKLLYAIHCVPGFGSARRANEPQVAYLHYTNASSDIYVFEMGDTKGRLSPSVAFYRFEKGEAQPSFGFWNLGRLMVEGLELDLDFEPRPMSGVRVEHTEASGAFLRSSKSREAAPSGREAVPQGREAAPKVREVAPPLLEDEPALASPEGGTLAYGATRRNGGRT